VDRHGGRNQACGVRRWRRADKDAIAAAISTPWSSGQVEGKVNRLKAIKRQMYGRAKIDLLKARLMAPA
jgi:transposase